MSVRARAHEPGKGWKGGETDGDIRQRLVKRVSRPCSGLQERQASELDEVWEHFRRKVKRNLAKAAGSAQFTLTLSLDSKHGDGLGQKYVSEARLTARRQAIGQFLERSRRQHQAPLQWRRQRYSALQS